MTSSFNTLVQKLRCVSWRDWILYLTFGVTLAALLALAEEIYWHSDIQCACLSTADNGRLIGVTTVTDFSRYRNRFYLFDDDLQLKISFRLRTVDSWGQHALSEDGKDLIYVLHESPDLMLEYVALDGSRKSSRIGLPSSIAQNMLGQRLTLNGVVGLELLGDPADKILIRDPYGTFLVDISGELVSYLEHVSYNSTINQNYAIVTAQKDRKWVIEGYIVDSDGLTQIYHEYPRTNPPNSSPGRIVLSTRGVFAMQDQDEIRFANLNRDKELRPESSVPWPISKGKPLAISDDASMLLLGNEKNLYAFSIKDQTVIGQFTVPNPLYIYSAMFLNNHQIVFSKSRPESGLVIWDLNDSTTKEVSFGNHGELTKHLIDLSFCAVVLIWAVCFYAFAIRRKYLWFGIAVLIAAMLIFIRCAHLAPQSDRLIINYRSFQILLAPVLCQVGLSVASLWTYRYLRFSLATALALCLACYTARWYHMLGSENPFHFFDAKLYFQNIVLTFAIEMTIVQSFMAWRSSKKLNSAILDLLILTVAAAIVTKLLKDVVLDGQTKNNILFGLIGGTIVLAQTFYAERRARMPMRRMSVVWLLLSVIGFVLAILLLKNVLFSFGIDVISTINFWLNLIVSDFIAFLLTWMLLRLIYRYFNQPELRNDRESALQPV